MSYEKPFGLYLFKKSSSHQIVLKELLQFIRTISPGQSTRFSYIEASTSLHPQLSLWENLQIETGSSTWQDFTHNLNPEYSALVNLLKNPSRKCADAEIWERFLVSLVKGLKNPSKHVLVDMNEEILSPILIQNFKRNMLACAEAKNIILATANTSLWLDCAHSLVERHEYKFSVVELTPADLKKHWIA